MFDFIEDTVQKLKPSLTSIIILFFKLSRVMDSDVVSNFLFFVKCCSIDRK